MEEVPMTYELTIRADPNNPHVVAQDYLSMAEMVVDDWSANLANLIEHTIREAKLGHVRLRPGVLEVDMRPAALSGKEGIRTVLTVMVIGEKDSDAGTIELSIAGLPKAMEKLMTIVGKGFANSVAEGVKIRFGKVDHPYRGVN